MESPKTEPSKPPKWQKTPAANLVKYVPSGKLFARVRIHGKLIVRSLKTKSFSVAQNRLSELTKRERELAASRQALTDGKMTFGQALEIFRQRLKVDHHLKQRSKDYREERIKALVKSWPGLEQVDVKRITKAQCLHWAGQYGQKASPTAFNNTVGTLTMVLDIAVDAGARHDNPAKLIKKARVRQKQLQLPSNSQFLALLKAIEESGTRYAKDSAVFVRFLAYTGCRKSEAATVTWADCEEKEIVIRGDEQTGTKNWGFRRVPILPDLRGLLQRLRSERLDDPASTPVLKVNECQGALTRACKKVEIPRITHHDLRHLFATRCIEKGCDIPTVSRWLGHKDGGALAMKTYGHLRNEHSLTMAEKVTFGDVAPANVVELTPAAGQ